MPAAAISWSFSSRRSIRCSAAVARSPVARARSSAASALPSAILARSTASSMRRAAVESCS